MPGQGNIRAEPQTRFSALFSTVKCQEKALSKMTVCDTVCRAVNLNEKPLNFSIKTYIKNYLSKTGIFDIIMVSGTVAQRPRDTERG